MRYHHSFIDAKPSYPFQHLLLPGSSCSCWWPYSPCPTPFSLWRVRLPASSILPLLSSRFQPNYSFPSWVRWVGFARGQTPRTRSTATRPSSTLDGRSWVLKLHLVTSGFYSYIRLHPHFKAASGYHCTCALVHLCTCALIRGLSRPKRRALRKGHLSFITGRLHWWRLAMSINRTYHVLCSSYISHHHQFSCSSRVKEKKRQKKWKMIWTKIVNKYAQEKANGTQDKSSKKLWLDLLWKYQRKCM